MGRSCGSCAITIVLALALSSHAVSWSAPRYERWVEDQITNIRAHEQAGWLGRALALADQALGRKPGCRLLLDERARLRDRIACRGRAVQSIAAYGKAMAEGRAAEARKEWVEADAVYRRALKAVPTEEVRARLAVVSRKAYEILMKRARSAQGPAARVGALELAARLHRTGEVLSLLAQARRALAAVRRERKQRYQAAMAQGARLEKDGHFGGARDAYGAARRYADDTQEVDKALERTGRAVEKLSREARMVVSQAFRPWDYAWLVGSFRNPDDLGWGPADWPNANKCEVAAVDRHGGRWLQVKGLPGPEIKIAVYRSWDAAVEFHSRKFLSFGYENASQHAVELAGAVWCDEYYETPRRKVAPGERGTLVFAFGAKDFKAESTQWKHTGAIGALVEVKRLFVVIYSKAPSMVYMGNIQALRTRPD